MEPLLTRVLRIVGTAVLVGCSLLLVSATRFTLQIPDFSTICRFIAFLSALGMLGSSIAAFWRRVPSLRRVEWSAYLGLAALLGAQFAVAPDGGPAMPSAMLFGVLVLSIVMARVLRRESAQAAACNCGH